MFNMNAIGLKIANMRKAAGMTQMGLADRLNISFQAVSSWERGQTMPDISKLREISEILGASIDDILGNKRGADIIMAVEAGTLPEDIPTMKELGEIGAILTPKQNNAVAEKIIKKKKEEGNIMDLREIASVAPFISSELIDQIAAKAAEEAGNLSVLCPVAPFMSSDAINAIAEKLLKEKGLEVLAPIIPFIDSEIIENYIKSKYL